MKKLGEFKKEYNNFLNRNYPIGTIYQSNGLKKHLEKGKHEVGLSYYDRINEVMITLITLDIIRNI